MNIAQTHHTDGPQMEMQYPPCNVVPRLTTSVSGNNPTNICVETPRKAAEQLRSLIRQGARPESISIAVVQKPSKHGTILVQRSAYANAETIFPVGSWLHVLEYFEDAVSFLSRDGALVALGGPIVNRFRDAGALDELFDAGANEIKTELVSKFGQTDFQVAGSDEYIAVLYIEQHS